MSYRGLYLLLLSLVFLVSSASAGISIENEAEMAYNSGDYDKAARLYEKLASEKGVSAGLYYDLGNVYYKSGDNGKARLYYERARRLDPGNSSIKNNLGYVAGKIEDSNRALAKGRKVDVMPDQLSFFESVHNAIAVECTSDYWSLFAAMAFLLTLGAACLYVFTSNVAARKVGFFSAGIFIFFTIVFICFSVTAAKQFKSNDEGVLMSYQTDLLTEPSDESSSVVTPLARGTKVKIVSSEENADGRAGWYKVRLNSDFVGWVRSHEIEII